MPTFPYIVMFVRRARLIAALAALFVLIVFGYAAWRTSCFDLGVLGLLLAPIAYVGVRLFGEIVQAIAETLLPR